MTSVLDLSMCIPARNQTNWELLERRNNKNEFRKNKPRDRRNLPLSILVKIRGPPKIVDSYKIQGSTGAALDKGLDMINGTSCTPVNITPFDDKREEVKRNKKGVIVLRPALHQRKQIPGRYFPKPTLTEDQQRLLLLGKDSPRIDFGDKSRTETSISTSSSKISKSLAKSTDSKENKRQDLPCSANPRILQGRSKTFIDKIDGQSPLFTFSFRTLDEKGDNKSELPNEYVSLKRLGSFSRQVSFPTKSDQFREMLTGTTKTLHQRKLLMSAPSVEQSGDNKEPTDVAI